MNIAFVIGHDGLRKGAYSDYLGKYEFDFYKEFIPKLENHGDVFIHNKFKFGYTARQRDTAKKTKNYDLVFELHFNAANGSANGCEALYYYKNKEAKSICEKFCKEYTSLTGTRNRGAKPLKDTTQRGFGFVFNQVPTAIILEPFFGDNKQDSLSFDISTLLRSVNNAIINHLKDV